MLCTVCLYVRVCVNISPKLTQLVQLDVKKVINRPLDRHALPNKGIHSFQVNWQALLLGQLNITAVI